ncbi:kinase-like domain-containing protein, partial [Dimargaris cristalligena]
SEETSEADSEEEAVCDEVLKEMEDLEQNFPAVAKQYRLISKIGEGTFSCVYKAVDVNYSKYDNRYWDVAPTPADDRPVLHQSKRTKVTNDPCSHQPPSREPRKYVAVKKIYVTSSPARIANEIQILKDLTGHPHVGPLITALRHEDQVLVVLPYFQHHDFRDYYRTMNLEQIKRYLYCLFSALEYTHRHKILHRDVKPSNFLFNIDTQHGVLVDFGLAHKKVVPHTHSLGASTSLYPRRPAVEQTPTIVDSRQRPGILRRDLRPSVRANRAGTRGFRAPEVLLKVTYQTQAIDIWSVGVIMLSILTHRFPFFNSTDDQEALLEMGVLFGKKEMERVASLHDRAFFTNVPTVRESAIPFDRLVKVYNSGGLAVFPPEVYDLLTQCFALDPNERITAQEALQH